MVSVALSISREVLYTFAGERMDLLTVLLPQFTGILNMLINMVK